MKKPTLAQREEKARKEVERAALAWWSYLRPLGWTLDEHLAKPCVNTAGARETRVALACARLAAIIEEKKRGR